ncbi:MAG: alcohol dehydrogenase catalytic domain-containing protein, partial [Gemmatimonadetes bacterium]|nr:alcohol dehydrogenase catalytic domain-containing protein [Gemmatimonadota bacterium]
MSVRAAVMPAPDVPVEVRSLPDPVLEPGSVLLETVASEVCGTDVHLHHGRLAGVPYPLLPGHVSVGRVLESRGVERDALGAPLAVGDVVTFYDVHEVCGACWHCLVARQPNRCPSRRVYGITYGVDDGLLGGWAERIHLKPGVRIVKLPEGLDADDVIGGGCGLFTGFGAVERGEPAMGDTVLVQGAGPVGLSAAAFAHLRGAGRVLVVGAPGDRLALARRMGADLTLDVTATDEAERARDRLLTYIERVGKVGRRLAARREEAEEALARRSEQREALARRAYAARSGAERVDGRLERVRALCEEIAERAEGRRAQLRALAAAAQHDVPDEAGRGRIEALEAALEMAHEIARFPQEAMLADRRSIIENQGASIRDGLRREWANGIDSAINQGTTGAGRFAEVRDAARALLPAFDPGGDPADAMAPAELRFYGGFAFRDDHVASDVWEGFPPALFQLPRLEMMGEVGGDARLTIR